MELTATLEPSQPQPGTTFKLKLTIQHRGELDSSGIMLTVTPPPGISFVGADLPADKCLLDDTAVLCFLGTLSQTEAATPTLTFRVNQPTDTAIILNVSANQPEARLDDNTLHIVVK